MMIPLNDFKLFSKEIQETNLLLENLSSTKNWDDKFRLLMIAGKKFPNHPSSLENDEFLVRGCESKAWLSSIPSNGNIFFLASSESKIIRGLLTLLISNLNAQSKEYILSFDAETLFNTLGLERHLSESRKGGFYTLWKEIKIQVSEL